MRSRSGRPRRCWNHRTARCVGAKRVLVCDDDAMVLVALRTMFGQWGCDVLAGSSTEEAIIAVRTDGRRPDFVVSDCRLRDGRFGNQAILAVRALCGAELPGLADGRGRHGRRRGGGAARVRPDHKAVTARQLAAILEPWLDAVPA